MSSSFTPPPPPLLPTPPLTFSDGSKITRGGVSNFNFLGSDGNGGNIVGPYLVKTLGPVCSWNHAPPGAQPATPVTLADVIAVLQTYGLTA